jgi:hypothetical protein
VEVGSWDGAGGEEPGEPGAAGIAAWCGGLGGGGDPDALGVSGRTFGERAIGVTVTKASAMDGKSGTAVKGWLAHGDWNDPSSGVRRWVGVKDGRSQVRRTRGTMVSGHLSD